MNEFFVVAGKLAALLKERCETVAVAESSAGGLISAALLAQPGASAYFLGGAVVYTYASRRLFLDLPDSTLAGIRPATEEYARLLARTVRQRLGATWGLAETGATGPMGNRYGDRAGHACLAIVGPVEHAMTLETSASDRVENMRAFAMAALTLFANHLTP